jgi:hypothetical protein
MADPGARSDAGSGSAIGLADRITLRPAEAAAALGVSERTFRSLLPRLPHFREGNVVLVPVDELRRWASERARGSGSVDSTIQELLAKVGAHGAK